MATLRILKIASRASASDTGAGPLSLGLIIAIVIVGAIIIATGFGFLILYLSRRRSALHRNYVDETSGEDTDTGATIARAAPRKLRKRDVLDEKAREISPVHQVPVTVVNEAAAPTIPPLFAKRISFNPFRGSWSKPSQSQGQGQTHKRKPSWIDEDALHGPKVTKQDDKRRSFRDSWPLKNMVPTLPKLGGIANQHAAGNSQQGQTPPVAPEGGPVPAAQAQIHHIPTENLPRPPKSAVIVHKRQPARNAINKVGNIYMINDPQIMKSTLNVSPTRPTGRMSSTDSTLSEILRSTEKRLQEGSTTGVAKRNKAAGGVTSSAKSTKSTDSTLPAKTPPRYRSFPPSEASSPNKTQPTTPSHKRTMSGSSLSEPESMYEDPRPTPQPSSLSSPNRKTPVRARTYSLSSSMSSSLSTVYSMDETQEGTTMVSTPPNSSLPDISKLPKIRIDTGSNDPFFPFSPTSAARLGMRSPEQHPALSPKEEADGTTATGMPSESPVLGHETPSRTSNSDARPTHSDMYSPAPTRADYLVNFDPLASVRGGSINEQNFRSPQGSPSNPCLIITSPSDASSIRTPASSIPSLQFLQRQAQLETSPTPVRSPEQEPCIAQGSPARRLAEFELGAVPVVPPLPDFAIRANGETEDPPSPTPKGQQKKQNRARVISTSSSVYSQDTKDDIARLAAEVNNASFQLNANIPPSPPLRQEPIKKEVATSPERSGSKRYGVTSGVGVGATIAELRRMNSAVSTMSGTSNHAVDDGSPTLPVLRGGGFGPTHRKCGSKNYLAVGSPPKKESPIAAGSGATLMTGQPGSPSRRLGPAQRKRISRQRAAGGTNLLGFRPSDVAEANEEMIASDTVTQLPIPRLELPDDEPGVGLREGNGGNTATPPKRLRLLWEDDLERNKNLSKRISTESLGLYDQDGFLISSPIRPPDSEPAKPSSGLRI